MVPEERGRRPVRQRARQTRERGETYEAEKRQFELGLRTSNDVLDASARLADARSREILAVVEYPAALVDAAFATGTIFGSGRIEWVEDDSFAGGRFEQVDG